MLHSKEALVCALAAALADAAARNAALRKAAAHTAQSGAQRLRKLQTLFVRYPGHRRCMTGLH